MELAWAAVVNLYGPRHCVHACDSMLMHGGRCMHGLLLMLACVLWQPQVTAMQLNMSLQKFDFLVPTGGMTIEVSKPTAIEPTKQANTLSVVLQLISTLAVRQETDKATVTIVLTDWDLTSATIKELRCLPRYKCPVKFAFRGCNWLPATSGDTYGIVPSLLPPCVKELHVDSVGPGTTHRVTSQQLIAMCEGARKRGSDCERLRLSVRYDPSSPATSLTDEERSQVIACADKHNLGRWVQLEWRWK